MPLINSLYFRFKNFFSAHWPNLFAHCEKQKSVIKFIFAGSSAAAVDLIFLYLFHGLFRWELVLSTSLAFILSFIVSFTLQKFWTFRNYSQKKIPVQFVLYIANAFIGLNLNGIMMHYSVNKMHVWYLFAQILVNILIGFYNFFIYKFIVFRKHPHETNRPQETTATSTGDLA